VQTGTVDEARDVLSAVVDQAASSRDVVTITKRVELAVVHLGGPTITGRR